ncbi:MAG: hypothetical protein P8J20_15590 [Novosphingobium sp.]|nr:hypothetical protein [Novosphingobium sp.]
MLPNKLRRNDKDISAIRSIAQGGEDGPVLMMNLNAYTPAAGYPQGELYQQYISGLEALVESLGARILWRLPVLGQPVGEEHLADELLAIWYPNHQAYLDVPNSPAGERNYELRSISVAAAVIYRCPGDISPPNPQ